MNDLHAGDLLAKRTLHLTVLDLAWVKNLLQQGCFLNPLIDADGRGREKQDQSIQVGRVDDLLDRLSGRWWIKCSLVVTGQRVVYVLDHCAVILADRDGETNLVRFLVIQSIVARRELQNLTLRVHVVLNDHVQIMHHNLVMCLAQYQLASVEKVAERERAWNLDRVEVHECFK